MKSFRFVFFKKKMLVYFWVLEWVVWPWFKRLDRRFVIAKIFSSKSLLSYFTRNIGIFHQTPLANLGAKMPQKYEIIMVFEHINTVDNSGSTSACFYMFLSLSWCYLCKNTDESIDHIFLSCAFSLAFIKHVTFSKSFFFFW